MGNFCFVYKRIFLRFFFITGDISNGSPPPLVPHKNDILTGDNNNGSPPPLVPIKMETKKGPKNLAQKTVVGSDKNEPKVKRAYNKKTPLQKKENEILVAKKVKGKRQKIQPLKEKENMIQIHSTPEQNQVDFNNKRKIEQPLQQTGSKIQKRENIQQIFPAVLEKLTYTLEAPLNNTIINSICGNSFVEQTSLTITNANALETTVLNSKSFSDGMDISSSATVSDLAPDSKLESREQNSAAKLSNLISTQRNLTSGNSSDGSIQIASGSKSIHNNIEQESNSMSEEDFSKLDERQMLMQIFAELKKKGMKIYYKSLFKLI